MLKSQVDDVPFLQYVLYIQQSDIDSEKFDVEQLKEVAKSGLLASSTYNMAAPLGSDNPDDYINVHDYYDFENIKIKIKKSNYDFVCWIVAIAMRK